MTVYVEEKYHITQDDAERVVNAYKSKTGATVKVHKTPVKSTVHHAPFLITKAQKNKIDKAKRNHYNLRLSKAQTNALLKKQRGGSVQTGAGAWWKDFADGFLYGITLPIKATNLALKETGLKDTAKNLAKGAATAAIATTPAATVAPILATGGVEALDYGINALGTDLTPPWMKTKLLSKQVKKIGQNIAKKLEGKGVGDTSVDIDKKNVGRNNLDRREVLRRLGLDLQNSKLPKRTKTRYLKTLNQLGGALYGDVYKGGAIFGIE